MCIKSQILHSYMHKLYTCAIQEDLWKWWTLFYSHQRNTVSQKSFKLAKQIFCLQFCIAEISLMSLFFHSGKKAGPSQVFSPPSPPEYDLSSTMVDPIFDYQFRVILIGDSTVGKSSLLRNFTDGTFAEVSDPTVGVDFFARLLKVSDGTTVKLQLWDTAGQVC